MTTFIQLHLLTAYPAANLNRDDTGAPKTVVLGGATRLRVSSQSLKRAWRTSALFEQALAGHIGIRSGRIAREAATIMIEKGIEEKKAIEWAADIADYLGKAKKDKKTKDPLTNAETEQLVHISPAEFDAVKALAHQLKRLSKMIFSPPLMICARPLKMLVQGILVKLGLVLRCSTPISALIKICWSKTSAVTKH